MPEEIKFIDNDEKPKLNEITEIKPIIENAIKQESNNQPVKKVNLPTWNIEPPVDIQRRI